MLRVKSTNVFVAILPTGMAAFPTARTYSDQVTSEFFFQPLLNGNAEGDKVEFDSAPASLQ